MVKNETQIMQQNFAKMGDAAIPLLMETLVTNKIDMLRLIAVGALANMENKSLKKIPKHKLELLIISEKNDQIKESILEILARIAEQ